MPLLVILLLLALIFGVGAVVKGILWLVLIALVVMLVTGTLAVGHVRGSRR